LAAVSVCECKVSLISLRMQGFAYFATLVS
jgi:hypothetical protein